MTYVAALDRYDDKMPYRRCGRSGLKLPEISLGLWQNFGDDRPLTTQRAIIRRAFDLGVTHFDLANNYGGIGPAETLGQGNYGSPYGGAEINFGRIMREDLRPYRDELIISTKAGYDMWPGPYGDHGSRKYLLASLDQSLRRMGLEYVDIFYSTGSTRTRRSRRRWARWTPRSAPARRCTRASPPIRPNGPWTRYPCSGGWARRCSSTSRPTRC